MQIGCQSRTPLCWADAVQGYTHCPKHLEHDPVWRSTRQEALRIGLLSSESAREAALVLGDIGSYLYSLGPRKHAE